MASLAMGHRATVPTPCLWRASMSDNAHNQTSVKLPPVPITSALRPTKSPNAMAVGTHDLTFGYFSQQVFPRSFRNEIADLIDLFNTRQMIKIQSDWMGLVSAINAPARQFDSVNFVSARLQSTETISAVTITTPRPFGLSRIERLIRLLYFAFGTCTHIEVSA